MTINQENTSIPKTTSNLQSEPSTTVGSQSVIDSEDSSSNDSVDIISITQLSTLLKVDLSPIFDFLGARTSQAWVNAAVNNLPLIIQDHANCEKRPPVPR